MSNLATDLGISVFDYKPDKEADPNSNLTSLIEHAKGYFPYSAQEWEDSTWDITNQEKKHQGQKGKRFRLIFACTNSRHGKRREYRYFSPLFSDLVKSFMVVRYIERGVGVGPQTTMLAAFRYIYQALGESWDGDVRKLNLGTFQLACDILKSREAESTCYRVGNTLSLISDMLTRFYITPIPVNFSSPFKRTSQHDPLSERTVDKKSKLQLSEELIEAIVHLDKIVTNDKDRLVVEFMKVLMFTGMRVSEALSLKSDSLLEKEENGELFVGLRYYPAKGGHKVSQKRWFGDLSGKLIKESFNRILDITKEPRKVAQWLVENPYKSYFRKLLPAQDNYSLRHLREAFGTNSIQTVHRSLEAVKLRVPVKIKNLDKPYCLKEKDKILFKDNATGYTVEIHKALFVIYKDYLSKNNNTKPYYVTGLKEGPLGVEFNGKPGKYSTPSIFERYDIKGIDGKPLRLTSHMFRRFLNTLYNEGGVPLTVLTKIFGRSNSKDTLSYIYTSPKEQTEKAREIFKNGEMIGPKADIANSLPIKKRNDFIDATVESVHHLGHGYCSHDWSTLPCEKHLQCLDKCVDYHVVKGDEKSKAYLLG